MKKIIFLLTFFLLLYTPYIVEAEDEYNIIDEIESPRGFEFSETAETIKSGKFPITFSDILKKVTTLFFESIKTNIPRIVKMLSIAILSGILVNLGEEKNDIGTFSAVAVVSTIAIKTFSDSVFLVNETLDGLFIFINSLITPLITMSAVGTVAYAPTAAGVFVSMQVFMHLCKSTLMPLICVICVFSVCDKMGNTPYLTGITNILKQILKWGTGLLITIYTVVIGLQSQTAATFDTLAGKTVKYAVGSFVPVVGGALSDSLETVILGAKTMAKVLGISGVLGVCYITVSPLVNIVAISLSFKIASAVASVTTERKVSSVIDEFAQSIAKVSIVLLSCTVMFIISIAMLLGHGG